MVDKSIQRSHDASILQTCHEAGFVCRIEAVEELAQGEYGVRRPLVPGFRETASEARGVGAMEPGSFPVRAQKPNAPEAVRSVQEMVDGAQQMDRVAGDAGENVKDWYALHKEPLERIFLEDSDLFEDIISVTSQNTTIVENVRRALMAYEQIKVGGPIDDLPLLEGVKYNLQRLVGEFATGRDQVRSLDGPGNDEETRATRDVD